MVLPNDTLFAPIAQEARGKVRSHSRKTSSGEPGIRNGNDTRALRVSRTERLRRKEWRYSETELDKTKPSRKYRSDQTRMLGH